MNRRKRQGEGEGGRERDRVDGEVGREREWGYEYGEGSNGDMQMERGIYRTMDWGDEDGEVGRERERWSTRHLDGYKPE